ncbi:hypothetical protein P1J78_24560, partial [Psychromarinibacter sp. C21-152]
MTYDRSAIMRRAWEIIRKADVARFGLNVIKRNALRAAWQEAKFAAEDAAARPVAELSAAEKELVCIENKNRQTDADQRRMEELRRIV